VARGERWIVDGMNVIGSRPDSWWRDRPAAMRSLVADLERWAAGRAVTVVFDGRPVDVSADRVEVAFARRRGQNAADDEIVRLVEADRQPRELRVVTSDGQLSRRVRELGAEVVAAASFRRALDSTK
jgi:predicted RNA-binding protein with PIN domain